MIHQSLHIACDINNKTVFSPPVLKIDAPIFLLLIVCIKHIFFPAVRTQTYLPVDHSVKNYVFLTVKQSCLTQYGE